MPLKPGNALNINSTSSGLVNFDGTATFTTTVTPTLTNVTFGSGTALSVYQEGTWTPTIDGSVSGTTNYNFQVGVYTKIGNTVFCSCSVQISSATGTGNMILGGLPFTVKNTTNYVPTFAVRIDGKSLPASSVEVVCQLVQNTTTANFAANTVAGVEALTQIANATITVYTSFFYKV